ncbi:MAG: hypothetical protein IPK80_00930 [Nannocystis sp.]|nr:hypothetical protein [Nannocystis sp.]
MSLAGDAWRQADPARYEVLERAAEYGADYVFFREVGGQAPVAMALVYVDDARTDDAFAELHRRLWNWGLVPLVYRKRGARVDLLRCAHAPDFLAKDGRLRYHAFATLDLLTAIDRATELAPWWDDDLLHRGSLWDDPRVCEQLCSADKSAHQGLIRAIRRLDADLHDQRNLTYPAPASRHRLHQPTPITPKRSRPGRCAQRPATRQPEQGLDFGRIRATLNSSTTCLTLIDRLRGPRTVPRGWAGGSGPAVDGPASDSNSGLVRVRTS